MLRELFRQWQGNTRVDCLIGIDKDSHIECFKVNGQSLKPATAFRLPVCYGVKMSTSLAEMSMSLAEMSMPLYIRAPKSENEGSKKPVFLKKYSF